MTNKEIFSFIYMLLSPPLFILVFAIPSFLPPKYGGVGVVILGAVFFIGLFLAVSWNE